MRFWKKTATLFTCLLTSFGMVACGTFAGHSGADASVDGVDSADSNVEAEVQIKVILQRRQFRLFLNGSGSASQIVAGVYENGVQIEDAMPTFTVEDPAVAEVATDGTITPKAVGKTNVTVSYNEESTQAEIVVVSEATSEQINSFDEAYINTYGRVYEKNGKLCLDYVGAGAGVAINGNSLTANIEVDTTLYLCVYVDGADEYERIELTPNKKEYTLATGLQRGFHTVRLVKSSEVYDGQIRLVSFSSEGFYTAPEKSDLRIEFIGDSITAGYGVLGGPGDGRTVKNSDACSSYAYHTAQALGADYSMIAIQGICVKANMWLNEAMSDIYGYVSPLDRVEYGFTYDPDVVVLNLGTNDGSYITGKDYTYHETFSEDYLAFLRYIREKNPNAYILCLYGMMGKQAHVDKGINKAIAEMQDDKVIRVDEFAPNNLGANGHPSASAQQGWGETLTEYIKDLLDI